MKFLSAILLSFLPALAFSHAGHGEHIIELASVPLNSVNVEGLVASLVLAAVIAVLIKRYKSKH